MRVIAGEAKGTRLARVPAGTRPMTDRAREGLFSSLGDRVMGATVADLYAGTGSIGIEALSRGAASCLFVDSGPAAVRTIRDNLARTGFADRDRARVVRVDVRRYFRRRRGPFDLLFLDPPFRFGGAPLRALLEDAARSLAGRGRLVVSRPTRDDRHVIPVNLALDTLLAYGDTRVLVLREDE